MEEILKYGKRRITNAIQTDKAKMSHLSLRQKLRHLDFAADLRR